VPGWPAPGPTTGQARNRTRDAVERTTPFALYCYTIVVIWYTLHGHHPADAADCRERQPWYTSKTEPAFADMAARLRRTIIAARFTANALLRPTDAEIRAVQSGVRVILCDTGPLVAAFNEADSDHTRCTEFLTRNWSHLVVPSLAVTEICHLLADPQRRGRVGLAAEFCAAIADDEFRLIEVTPHPCGFRQSTPA
jgi:hypothetical protein